MTRWTDADLRAYQTKQQQPPPPIQKPPDRRQSIIVCHLTPIGKPRMTRRDKWAKRPCVLRYREFADNLRACFDGVDLAGVHALSWTAYFPLPASWSRKRRSALAGQGHQSKPDRDNVDKAILDALFDEDSGISHGTLTKLWDDGAGPRIEIEIKKQAADNPSATCSV